MRCFRSILRYLIARWWPIMKYLLKVMQLIIRSRFIIRRKISIAMTRKEAFILKHL